MAGVPVSWLCPTTCGPRAVLTPPPPLGLPWGGHTHAMPSSALPQFPHTLHPLATLHGQCRDCTQLMTQLTHSALPVFDPTQSDPPPPGCLGRDWWPVAGAGWPGRGGRWQRCRGVFLERGCALSNHVMRTLFKAAARPAGSWELGGAVPRSQPAGPPGPLHACGCVPPRTPPPWLTPLWVPGSWWIRPISMST